MIITKRTERNGTHPCPQSLRSDGYSLSKNSDRRMCYCPSASSNGADLCSPAERMKWKWPTRDNVISVKAKRVLPLSITGAALLINSQIRFCNRIAHAVFFATSPISTAQPFIVVTSSATVFCEARSPSEANVYVAYSSIRFINESWYL